jgi:FMN-dependent NADH-azoreductase
MGILNNIIIVDVNKLSGKSLSTKTNNELINFYNDNEPKSSPHTKKKHKRTRKKKK